MKNLNLGKITPFIITTIFFGLILHLQLQRKSILVLHSYAPDYSWVRDVNEGVKRALRGQSFVNVYWHYMNTKNHPDLDYKKKAGATARKIIDFVKPNILLSIDDDAQEFAARFYKNKPNIYIVYAGVNALPERYGYHEANNVVGILERLPIRGIKDALYAIGNQMGLNGPLRVSHVSDNSTVVKSDDFYMQHSKDWHPIVLGPSFLVGNFDEWKKVILEADKHMDVMLISNYRKILVSPNVENRYVPYKEAMQWAFEHSPVPIIGINGFVCEDGAALSIATSPFEQGQVSMQMAVDLVTKKKKIEEIQVAQTSQYIVVMNEQRMKKSKIQLPSTYMAFARAINKYEGE